MIARLRININKTVSFISNNFVIQLCKLLPIFCPKNLHINDLYNFKNNGYVRLNNFINENQILSCKKAMLEVIKGKNFEINTNALIQEGNIKLSTLHNHSKFLKNMSRKYFYIFISCFFYGYPKRPNIIFTYSSDGKLENKYVKGKCKKQIAGEPHVDSYKNYLKILILLDDVNIDNGPTNFIAGSANNKMLKNFYENCFENKQNNALNKTTLNELYTNYEITQFIGKKGDMFLVNTKNLHWAGEMNSGTREILWLYF